MRALTLHQPWASFIALGVKHIETRHWSTSYRGPLAIHAGKASGPPDGYFGDHVWNRTTGCLWHRKTFPVASDYVPFGAIVASCELVDVVPICAIEDEQLPPCVAVGPTDVTLWEVPDYWHNESDEVDVSDQRPYGNFTPGRYAWLLDDIRPVDPPVPCRGRQGLWNWTA